MNDDTKEMLYKIGGMGDPNGRYPQGENMTERLIEKLDRLAAEAGIKEVTPELRRFALLVRADVVAEWPKLKEKT